MHQHILFPEVHNMELEVHELEMLEQNKPLLCTTTVQSWLCTLNEKYSNFSVKTKYDYFDYLDEDDDRIEYVTLDIIVTCTITKAHVSGLHGSVIANEETFYCLLKEPLESVLMASCNYHASVLCSHHVHVPLFSTAA